MALPVLYQSKEERSEKEINEKSPRKFFIGNKEFTSYALSNYQYKILFNCILALFKNQSEEEIRDYLKEGNENLLFNEFCSLEFFKKKEELQLELFILSCCDPEVNATLISLLESEAELSDQFKQYICIPENKFKLFFDLAGHINTIMLSFKSWKLSTKVKNLRTKLQKRINQLCRNSTHYQFNIAFNYIIEQNDIFDTALGLLKKKKIL